MRHLPGTLGSYTMHACPCGYFSDSTNECRCTGAIIQRYLSKVSGPLLDRIDLHVEVPAVAYKELRQGSRRQLRRHARASRDCPRNPAAARLLQLTHSFALAEK